MSTSKAGFGEISKFILENVAEHPTDITSITAEKFGISRQAVLRHLNKMLKDGSLLVVGQTKDRRYSLKPDEVVHTREFSLAGLEEDKAWRTEIRPLLKDIPQNILAICQYGFTEMVNNAIDHSGGSRLQVLVTNGPGGISLSVSDDGVGIFRKIQQDLGLDDERHAILELSKGKLTTDARRHTGEGIFFTSRMFDLFGIVSYGLYFHHTGESGDWLLGDEPDKPKQYQTHGTTVMMQIHPGSKRTTESVFDVFANPEQNFGFSKTQIPVFLAQYGDENLVSRSQAKRLLARVERFREVVFDFKGVNMIGQAFADEVFRVFQNENPHVHLTWINAAAQIEGMIAHVLHEAEQ
jgi:anti-sigma regulatory factor (Ser/Thr protein kinase)